MQMNRSEKIWGAALVFSSVVVIVTGFIVKSNFSDSGLSEIKNYKDLVKHDIRITEVLGAVNAELMYSTYEIHMDDMVNRLSNSSVIAVVKPTGRLEIADQSLGQEFIVVNAMKGNLATGDIAKLYSSFGFNVETKQQITYNDSANLMNPQYDYLVFMEESQLNEYNGENNFMYIGAPSYFRLLEDKPVVYNSFDRKWETYQNAGFFVATERGWSCILSLKSSIIDKYDLKY